MIHDRLDAKSDRVVHLLNESDLVLANLETTLATKGYPAAKRFNLWAKHSVVEDFKRMGVTAMALANNHTMDFGFEGLFETIEVLNAHGIGSAGAGHNLAEALKPAILGLGGLKVAFISCSCEVTSHAIARDDRPGLAPLRVNVCLRINTRDQQEEGGLPSIKMEPEKEDLDKLMDTLRSVRDGVDIAVVSIHWGQQLQPMVFDYQSEIAHTLIDNGTDIVMGHSPHVLNGIEVYKRRFIFYSLGHFVFQTNQPGFAPRVAKLPDSDSLKRALADPFRWRLHETAIGKVVLEGSRIEYAEIIPITLDQSGNPLTCDGESAMPILHYLAVISRYLGTTLIIRESRALIMA